MTFFADDIQTDAELNKFLDDSDTVTIEGKTVKCIILDDFKDNDPRAPGVLVKESDLAGVDHGATVVVRGETKFLQGYQPDNTGMATLVLGPRV
jgi:hypothetical protein